MESPSRPSRPFGVLSFAVALLGAAGFGLSLRIFPLQVSTPLVLLALAAVLSENYALDLTNYTISLAYPMTVAAIVFAGPTGAALVVAVTAINVGDFRNRTAPSVMLFNIGELVSVTLLAGWAYVVLGGRILGPTSELSVQPFRAGDFPGILVPFVVVALVCTFGNLAMMGVGVSLYHRQRLRSSLVGVAWLVPSQLALAFVGYLVAQVLAINLVALPLFVAPLLVARQLYQRYAAAKEAYADTVRSLVGALEAKDPYTRGHSERVAKYSLELGVLVGLDTRMLERLEYAALLHDLGKLAVPGALLTKPGLLTNEEMESVRHHAARGAEMVARIPPLRDLSDFVGSHHEWYDGSGYPLQTRSPEIPLLSLIMAVADSYDAMTTTRAYRRALTHDEAIAELIGGAGSQFDPNLVRTFIEGHIGRPERGHDRPEETSREAIPRTAGDGAAC